MFRTYTYPLAWADANSQVLQVRENCTHFTYSLRTDSYISCREYCKQFEMNTARYLLSEVFIGKHFKWGKQKRNLTYSLRLYCHILYLGAILIYFVSCQTNRRGQKSPKVPKEIGRASCRERV